MQIILGFCKCGIVYQRLLCFLFNGIDVLILGWGSFLSGTLFITCAGDGDIGRRDKMRFCLKRDDEKRKEDREERSETAQETLNPYLQ